MYCLFVYLLGQLCYPDTEMLQRRSLSNSFRKAKRVKRMPPAVERIFYSLNSKRFIANTSQVGDHSTRKK
jgi:hypothetical protein